MSIFGDLKRVFFGAKAVTKHQAEKAGDALSEASDDLVDSTKDLAKDIITKAPGVINQGKEALEDLADKVWREADAVVDKGKDLKDQASDAVNEKLSELRRGADPEPEPEPEVDPLSLDLDRDFGDLTVSEPADAPKSGKVNWEEGLIEAKETVGKGLAKANEVATPALDAAAKAGLAAKAQAEKLAGKIGDISEVVGEKVLEKGDEVLNRAAEVGSDLKGKFDDFVDHADSEAKKMKMEEALEEAKRAAEQAEARARAFDGKEAARDTSETLLDGTGSFFDRAERFAEGDYHNEGGKDMTIGTNPDAPKKPEGGLIAGFDDRDGDGDSLIDDAVIDED